MQEIFYTLHGTVFLPFKGWKALKSINFPAPLMVRPDVSGKGQSIKDIITKTNLEALHAGRINTVWNTNDNFINNRSHTNQVAVESYQPTKAEIDYRGATTYEVLPSLYRNQNHRMIRPLLTLKLSPHEGTRPAAYRSRDGVHPSPRYVAEYCAALWEDVLNSTLRSGNAESKVSPRVMLELRCHDPNILYNAGSYTLDTYKDSLQMEDPLLVCINKVKHKEPIFFSTVEEMKQHWQPCLNLTLVAQGTQVSKVRGRGRQLNSKVDGSKSCTLAEVSNSSRIDTPSTSAQEDDNTAPPGDIVMHDVEKVLSKFAENESDDES